MSFYNKYRPQKISELHLTKVREQLLPILKTGKLSSVYIFVGPKGTGKTSAARILAKLVNCEKNVRSSQYVEKSRNNINLTPNQFEEPCGECDSCKRITSGASLAVMEMDAASNRGIDDIRILKERVMAAPADGKYSVYIIDEVHMLTNEAFNALLKTLEEPPPHALFFLCTTDPQKIPETVMSRGTRIQYSKASSLELQASLIRVVSEEKITISDEALAALSNRVDGSFRDGMKLLEQLAMMSKDITMNMVDELTGNGEIYQMKSVIELLLSRDVVALLNLMTEKWRLGAEPILWYRRLVEEVRRQILAGIMSEKSVTNLVEIELWLVTNAQIVLNSQMSEIGVEAVLSGFAEKLNLTSDRKNNESTVDLGRATSWVSQNSNSANVPTSKPQLEIATPVNIPMAKKPAEAVMEVSKTTVNIKEEVLSKQNQTKEVSIETSVETVNTTISQSLVSDEEIKRKWPLVMAETRKVSSGLETALRGSVILGIDGEYILIEVGYKLFKDRLEQDRYRKLLEGILVSIYGARLLTRYSFKNKPKSGQDEVSAVVNDPVVNMAAEAFGAI